IVTYGHAVDRWLRRLDDDVPVQVILFAVIADSAGIDKDLYLDAAQVLAIGLQGYDPLSAKIEVHPTIAIDRKGQCRIGIVVNSCFIKDVDIVYAYSLKVGARVAA